MKLRHPARKVHEEKTGNALAFRAEELSFLWSATDRQASSAKSEQRPEHMPIMSAVPTTQQSTTHTDDYLMQMLSQMSGLGQQTQLPPTCSHEELLLQRVEQERTLAAQASLYLATDAAKLAELKAQNEALRQEMAALAEACAKSSPPPGAVIPTRASSCPCPTYGTGSDWGR